MKKVINDTYPEIREVIAKNGLRYYEIAAEMCVANCTLMRWLKSGEMTEGRRKRVEIAIKELIAKQKVETV